MFEGPIRKSLLFIAMPIIIANILQSLYQLIDAFWVGRLGKEAVAAVSLSFPVMFLLLSLAMGFAMAGSIIIAQANGKGNHNDVNMAFGQTFSFVVGIAIFLAFVGYILTSPILGLLTNDPHVLSQAISYLKISFLALPAIFIFNIFQGGLRGVGEVKMPMIMILISVVINFFLDPILMLGWGKIPAMGVAGVARATLITEYFCAVLGICLLLKKNTCIHFGLVYLLPKINWIKKIVRLGIPSAIEHSTRALGMVAMVVLVTGFGTLAMASYGIGTRILSFIIIPALGLSIGANSLMGNHLGAQQQQRAEKISKTALRIGFFSLSFLGVLLFVFAKPVVAFFVPNDPETIAQSALFLKIMALSFGTISMQMVMLGGFKSSGKTSTSMFLAFSQTVILIFTGWLLAYPFGLGILGVWISYPVSNVVSLAVVYLVYRKKTWLETHM